MHYEWAVIERYPDGTEWKHFFVSQESASSARREMQEAHPARTYTFSWEADF